jgi:hypothetical protein
MNRTATHPTNPLSEAAAHIPAGAATALAMAAVLIGAAFAFLYAYDQDTLFPGRHFPRTWVLVSVASTVAIAGTAASAFVRGWLAAFAGSLGAGMLFFAGANLANKAEGVAVLLAGAAACMAIALAAERRGVPPSATVAGLVTAAAATFAVVGACVLLVSGNA